MGHVARRGERRVAYKALVGRPDGKRQLGRPDRRSENNIEVEFQEMGLGHWLDSFGSRCREVDDLCECVNGSVCSIKCGKISFLAEDLLTFRRLMLTIIDVPHR